MTHALPSHLQNTLWIADPHMAGAARPLLKDEAWEGPVYGSIVGLVLYENVQACAFAQPVKAEPYWAGKRVMNNNCSIAGLTPDGVRSAYNVAAIPGTPLMHPPKRPEDISHQ